MYWATNVCRNSLCTFCVSSKYFLSADMENAVGDSVFCGNKRYKYGKNVWVSPATIQIDECQHWWTTQIVCGNICHNLFSPGIYKSTRAAYRIGATNGVLLLSRDFSLANGKSDYLRMLRLTSAHGPLDSRHSINWFRPIDCGRESLVLQIKPEREQQQNKWMKRKSNAGEKANKMEACQKANDENLRYTKRS